MNDFTFLFSQSLNLMLLDMIAVPTLLATSKSVEVILSYNRRGVGSCPFRSIC